MALESVSVKTGISKKISRAILIFGAIFAVVIFLSTFVPRGVPVNRLGVSLLLLFALLSLTSLYFLPSQLRITPFPFLYGVISVIWVSALIYFTGGYKSDFFPLFYLILVFGGLYLERPWEVATLVILVSLGYTSHYLYAQIMRDSLRDFLVVRVPVYFAAAFIPYYLIREARKVREEKSDVEELATNLDVKAKQMEVLFSISNKVGRVLRVHYVLDAVVSSAAIAMNADYSTIHLLEEEDSKLELAASHGFTKKSAGVFKKLGVGEGVMGWVAQTGEQLNLLDALKDYRFDYYRGDNKISSLLSVPMVVGARTIGVLTVFNAEPREFTKDDIVFISTLAGEAAIIIQNAQLYEETEELTLEDALTGLYNIRRLQAALDEELRRAKRYKREFSFLMLDIDYFKHYNDTNGHPQGDVVLQKVAEIMEEESRDVDTVFRYGGEEFCIILPETTKEEAYEVAERLRRVIQEHYFLKEENQPNKTLTVSIGVATYPADAVSKEGLIDKADKAMYEAKRAGRNKVVVT